MPSTIISELQLFGKHCSRRVPSLISLATAHMTYACGKLKHLVTKKLGGKRIAVVWSATHADIFVVEREMLWNALSVHCLVPMPEKPR